MLQDQRPTRRRAQAPRLFEHVPDNVRARLAKAGITSFRAMLTASTSNVAEALGMSIEDAEAWIRNLSAEYVAETHEGSPVTTAWAIAHLPSRTSRGNVSAKTGYSGGRVSSGCKTVDALLQGGAVRGQITEIAGDSSAGKTQLALSWVVEAVSGGARAVVISTEGSAHILARRVSEMHAARPSRGHLSAGDIASRVFIEECVDAQAQARCILTRLPALLSSTSGVDVVVVDSMAAAMRGEGAAAPGDPVGARAAQLFEQAAQLRRLAADHGFAVVVTNQVTGKSVGLDMSTIGALTGSGPGDTAAGETWSIPALGLAWSNCVNTRLFLSRVRDPGRSGNERAADIATEAMSRAAAAPPPGEAGLVRTGGVISGYVQPTAVRRSQGTAGTPAPDGRESLRSPLEGPGPGPARSVLRRLRLILSPHLPPGGVAEFEITAAGPVSADVMV